MSARNGLDVLAVVVSYEGGVKTRATVEALLRQVGHVHVVDNGSGAESVRILRELLAFPSVSATFLERNEGIAAALNVGVRVARERGYPWVLTMDQDSLIGAGMLDAYAGALARSAEAVCLVPNVLANGVASPASEGPVEFAITSGTLVRTSLFDEVGQFEESLFIDGVDIDYSLRIRQRGYQIIRVRGATIHHELGNRGNVSAVVARVYTEHSPLRRYYMYRNHLYLMKAYWRAFPGFIARATAYQMLLLLLVVIYDREPGRSLRFILKGIRDFFGGRMGAFREVA